jgi:hypothetical protein
MGEDKDSRVRLAPATNPNMPHNTPTPMRAKPVWDTEKKGQLVARSTPAFPNASKQESAHVLPWVPAASPVPQIATPPPPDGADDPSFFRHPELWVETAPEDLADEL